MQDKTHKRHKHNFQQVRLKKKTCGIFAHFSSERTSLSSVLNVVCVSLFHHSDTIQLILILNASFPSMHSFTFKDNFFKPINVIAFLIALKIVLIPDLNYTTALGIHSAIIIFILSFQVLHYHSLIVTVFKQKLRNMEVWNAWCAHEITDLQMEKSFILLHKNFV